MGLLDQAIGAALGSRTGSGKSQMVMALLALLASRAMTNRSPSSQPTSTDLGGLGGLVDRFRTGGLEEIINSWIGTGANKPISPTQLQGAIGQETLDDLAQRTGMPQQDLLSQLSALLPGVVDKLTPNGQMPAESELLAGPREDDGR